MGSAHVLQEKQIRWYTSSEYRKIEVCVHSRKIHEKTPSGKKEISTSLPNYATLPHCFQHLLQNTITSP